MDCSTCKERQAKAEPVTFAAYESMKVTLEATIRRLWVLAIILIVLLFGTNAAWLYYESQWEVFETSIEAEQIADNGGSNYAIGGDYIGGAEG